MLKQFYPKEWTDSTYGIPWETWYGKGIRGVSIHEVTGRVSLTHEKICHAGKAL